MIDAFAMIETWSVAIVRASWQGAVLAAAVWLACRLAPALAARYQAWLWRLVLAKFLIAIVWGMPIELPLLSPDSTPSVAGVAFGSPLPAEYAVETVTAVRDVSALAVALFTVWLAGVGWHTIGLIASAQAAKRLRRECTPCRDDAWLAQLAATSHTLGLTRSPKLLEHPAVGSPLLIGLGRPAVIVPTPTLHRFDQAERALVLSHELAHLCRGDLQWNLLAAVIRALFWFHPLVWLAERQLRLTQEIAADALSITTQQQTPLAYATRLVSIVEKLGPVPRIPTMCVGATGSPHTLQQRLTAMRFMKPTSRRALIAYTTTLALVALVGVVPWKLVAAEPATKANHDRKIEAMEKSGRGKFVSFENGKLTLLGNSGSLLVWNSLPAGLTGVQFNHTEKKFLPVADATAALSQAKPGMWVQVFLDKGASVRIDERKGATTGTFVSYKDQRLLILGTNLGASFTKKYGNQVHFNKFAAGVPIYESIDGGAYKLTGVAEQVLPNVLEGTIVTVHAEGDDNITMIQLGVPK
jgi:beta-lactamase regulating signal transducer with metallopeptidase domain